MQSPLRLIVLPTRRRQLAMSLDRPTLNGMTSTDRNAAVRRLALLLMQAAGVDAEEIGDDKR